MTNFGSVIFILVPPTGLIGAARSFLGIDGNGLAGRLAGFPFLAVGITAAYLDYRYVKRPADPDYN
jgi:hypothetical protein